MQPVTISAARGETKRQHLTGGKCGLDKDLLMKFSISLIVFFFFFLVLLLASRDNESPLNQTLSFFPV